MSAYAYQKALFVSAGQAGEANALWHFDMSPSDLKHLRAPPWVDADRPGAPTLMLFSVVDDRSGVAYQEYRCVYGEDVEAALRFLFNAMAPKLAAEESGEANPFQGIPAALSLDNGPVAKSAVFKRVMESLGIEVMPHMPARSDGRRVPAEDRAFIDELLARSLVRPEVLAAVRARFPQGRRGGTG